MRKLLPISVIIVLLLVGCQNIKVEPRTAPPSPSPAQAPNVVKPAFSPSEAIGVVENYLFALSRQDDKAARGLLTETGKRDHIGIMPNPHPNGYHVVEGQVNGENYDVTAVLDSVYTGNPFYDGSTFRLTVVKENNQLRISEIARQEHQTLKESKGALFLSDGTEQKLFELTAVPKEMTPQGAEVTMSFGIGRSGFGPVALAPDRKRTAFSTVGTHAMVGVYDIALQKIIPVDLYYSGNVLSLAWSPSGDKLAVEVNTAAGVTNVVVYDKALKRIETKIRAAYPIPNFSISSPVFAGDTLAFYLNPVEKTDDKVKAGWYIYDFASEAITPMPITP